MKIPFHQFKHSFGIIFQVFAQCRVVIAFQFFQDTVDHARTKDIMLFEYGPLLLQAFGRSGTAIRQLVQCFQASLVFFLMNIHVHIRLLGHIQRIGDFKPVAASDCQSRQIRQANAFRPSASAWCRNGCLLPTGLPTNTYPSWRPIPTEREPTRNGYDRPSKYSSELPGEEPDGNKRSGSYCRKP